MLWRMSPELRPRQHKEKCCPASSTAPHAVFLRSPSLPTLSRHLRSAVGNFPPGTRIGNICFPPASDDARLLATPAAPGGRSGTIRDGCHKLHPARLASNKTSNPRPALAGTRDSVPDREPRRKCTLQSAKPDAPPPAETIRLYPPVTG